MFTGLPASNYSTISRILKIVINILHHLKNINTFKIMNEIKFIFAKQQFCLYFLIH